MKKNIALLAGGYTGEYEVSLNSALNIERELDNQLYQVFKIIIDTQNWYYTDANNHTYEINKNDFSLNLPSGLVHFYAAFITIHGTPGEDGKLQGYFDMLGIPYNTCGTTTAALTMNKAYTKAVVHNITNLFTAKALTLFKNTPDAITKITHNLKFPLFIKPNNGGSSVGMSKVNYAHELENALKKAFKEDNQILVEEFIQGREFSIGLAKLDGEIKVLPATEIITSKEFFDYEAKYTSGLTQEITPAQLSDVQSNTIKQIVTTAYKVLNCKGMVRIDFILQQQTQNFYFIEINTTPGQSANSLIPQQLKAAGINIGWFYAKLIEECLKPSV
ncbi:MAG: D-alanine--D-alanine ligase [Sphingobacteriales bacterium]|nr:MAG: D-alanine--D-alanine ligase [Sphingobacteriales bacterium]TAF80122.1 MAG: D-alanine--D-alanine ligase [Sphingobacteriales bacterium]